MSRSFARPTFRFRRGKSSIFSIFTAQSDANRQHLAESLNKLRAKRLTQLHPAPSAGIPDISLVPDEIEPKQTVEVNVSVIVSDLPPRTKRQFQVSWTLPRWANPKSARETISLENGLSTLRHKFAVPAGVDSSAATVSVDLSAIPLSAGEPPLVAHRSIEVKPEPRLLVWVMDGTPIVNPGNRTASRVQRWDDQGNEIQADVAAGSGGAVQQTLSETFVRAESGVTYRSVATSSKPGECRNCIVQFRISWNEPPVVVRPGQKMALSVQLQGESSNDGKVLGVPWLLADDILWLQLATEYNPPADMQGPADYRAAGKIDFDKDNFDKPQSVDETAPEGQPDQTIALYLWGKDLETAGVRKGTVVIWPYKLERLSVEEIQDLLKAAGQTQSPLMGLNVGQLRATADAGGRK